METVTSEPEIITPDPDIKNPKEAEVIEGKEYLRKFGDLADPPILRIALNSGFTYQYGGYEGFPSSYTRQIKSLWNWGSEIHFFPSKNFGIGIKFNRISTKVQ